MKHIFKKNQVIITGLAVMIAVAGYLNYSGTKLGEEASSAVSEDTATATDETDTAYIDIESLDGDADLALEESLEVTDTAEGEILEGEDTAEGQDLSDPEQTAQADVTEGGETAQAEAAEGEDAAQADSTDTANAEPEPSETPGEAVLTSLSAGSGFAAEAKMTREQVRAKNKETLLEVINNVNISEEQKQEAIDSMTAMTQTAEKEAAAGLLLESKGFADSVVSISDEGADVVVSLTEITDAQRAQIEDIVKRKTDIAGENIVITTATQQEE